MRPLGRGPLAAFFLTLAVLGGCPDAAQERLLCAGPTCDAGQVSDAGSAGDAGDAGLSVAIERGACFYSEPNFGGESFCVELSTFSTDVVTLRLLNSAGARFEDRVASLHVRGAVRAALFAEAFGQGASAVFEAGDFPVLPPELTGAVSSFELTDVNECEEGLRRCGPGQVCTNAVGRSACVPFRVCLFETRDFGGQSLCLEAPASRASLGALAGRVSSVLVTGPAAVTLYPGDDDRGSALRLTAPAADLSVAALAFNDRAHAFEVALSSADELPEQLTCRAPMRPMLTRRVGLERVYPLDWRGVTAGAFAPANPARLYVVEKEGLVAFADPSSTNKRIALDLRGRVYAGLDAGIVGLAFSPRFTADGHLFLVYNTRCDAGSGGRNPVCPSTGDGFVSRVSRFTSLDAGETFALASEKVLLDSWNAIDNHTIDSLVFGPDGFLYISTGDGGNACTACQINGQNLGSLRGKILRVDALAPVRDAGGALNPGCVDDAVHSYCVPNTNPFVGAGNGAAPEIWALGLRNPWKMSFDPLGRLWAGDVGQDTFEEVNLIEPGGNYGWAVREGPQCHLDGLGGVPCSEPSLRPPVAWYDHATGGNSVTGGYVYRGSVASIRGAYVFGDFVRHKVWALWPEGEPSAVDDPNLDTVPGWSDELLFTTDDLVGGPSTFIPAFLEDAAGELYVVVSGDEGSFNGSRGEIYKLVEAGDAFENANFPRTLSETGCFKRNEVTSAFSSPAPELFPYVLQVPFWSDGAEKHRWVALPSGGRGTGRMPARTTGSGDHDFPPGTLFAKEFRLSGRRIETRLFMRHGDGFWAGYTYRWRPDQLDADLVTFANGFDEVFGEVTWHYPSSGECMRCHTAAAGRALGPEVLQLDRGMSFPGGRPAGQLATWDYLGLRSLPDVGLAWYRFEEVSGNVAADALGGTSRVVGAATWEASTRGGAAVRALRFDGATYLETSVPNGAERTLAAWILPRTSDAVPFIESVFDSDIPTQYGSGFGLAGGYYRVILDNMFWDTGVPVRLGEWQHVALAFDATRADFYVDGQRVASLDYVQGVLTQANYLIGKSHANPLYFDGLIDDARIFGARLDDADIRSVAFDEVGPMARLVDPYAEGSGTLSERARSWLHANCASCHRPEGGGPGPDLRVGLALDATRTCDHPPRLGAAGLTAPDLRLIAPGAPERSVLLARVRSVEPEWRMPPISSHVVDRPGADLLERWIRALTRCDE